MIAVLLTTALPASAKATQLTAAEGVLERLVGERASDFSFSLIPKADGAEVYEIDAADGRVRVAGSSGVAICRGAYDYLKKTCHVLYSWEAARESQPLAESA